MKTKQIVAYYRCSTKDQHYGIQVQKTQMHEFLEANNNEFEIIAEFEEHKSVKKNNRIELAKEIKYCEDNGSILGFTKTAKTFHTDIISIKIYKYIYRSLLI